MAAERRLMVDWPACKGHGLCAELVPELVTLDEWGYPILADQPVTRGVQAHAQRAVAACPTLALLLVEQTNQITPPRPTADDPISGAIRAASAGPAQRRPEPRLPERLPEPAPIAHQPAEPAPRRPEPAPRRAEPTPRRAEPAPRGPEPVPSLPEPVVSRSEPMSRRAARSRRAEPADDPITGAIQAVTGSFATRRGTPPTGMVRHAAGSSEPPEDPITGAIRAVTGPQATRRVTPPTGVARHATPAYGQPALVPEADSYAPGDTFFDGYAPREAFEQPQPSSSPRRRARQEEAARSRTEEPSRPAPGEPGHQPRTRREARAKRR